MATGFRPNSVISDVNVQAPDFGMLTKAAASVQGRYVEGFNKYKSIINSLLNAKIRSDDNINFRSDYFKKIDDYLSNLSGVDFSNPANVSIANDLMGPLTKDPEFVADLNSTMMQNSERNKMDQVRMSTDEKVHSQYSPIMERAMSYSDQDMKNAKRGDGSISKVGVQRYVPFANIQKSLNDAAHDQGLEIKTDHLTGAYIVTDTNGKPAYSNFTQWARAQLGNTYDEQLLVTGKVNTRQQLDSLMSADPKLTKDQAFQQIAKDNSMAIYSNYNEYQTSLNNGVSTIDKQMKDITLHWKNKIPKGSEDEAMYSQLKKMKAEYQKELADSAANKTDTETQLHTTFQQFMNNPEYAMLPLMKDGLARQWAKGYADAKVGHEIKVNQKALQDDAQAWQKVMADYNDKLERGRMQLKASLDFQSDIAKGNIVGGSVSQGPGELSGKVDAWELHQKDMGNLLDESIKNYFNPTVLSVASNSAPGEIKYAQLSGALMDVVTNLDKYKGDNLQKAPDTYKNNYNSVLTFMRKINPNITSIDNVSQIMKSISGGVASFRGDHKQWVEANEALEKGAVSFSQYSNMKNEYADNFKLWQKSDWNSSEYWTVDPKTGMKTPRADLDPATKEAMYQTVVPHYESTYKNRTAQTNSTWAWNGDPTKFNYGAIDEVLQKATYITGTSDSHELNSKEAKRIRDSFAQAGGELADIFNPQGMYASKALVGGKEYIKVVVPVKTDEKMKKKIAGVEGGAISFYVSPEEAQNLWQSKSYYSFMGNTITKPTYGDLSGVPQLIYNSAKPTPWIRDGLSMNGSAPFPDYLKTFGIEDGYLMFDKISGGLHTMVKTNGQEREYNMGLTYSDFMDDPENQSKTIMNTLEKALGEIRQAQIKKRSEHDVKHNINTQTNPDNYINSEDIK